VLQTAGRVIRSEQDHGIVVLADSRFTDPFYRDLYPAQWQLQRCRNDSELDVRLHEFWAEHFSLTGC
jgi:Rad3-related DNA helicase